MQRFTRWSHYTELAALFFIHGAALSMWFVPLTTVLDAHGFRSLRPYAFATMALAAFVSPLIFGAMVDRHASPVRVLRGLAIATSAAMALASAAIHLGWPPGVVLALIQVHALCSSPTWSISSTIILTRLQNPKREFGPVRATATLGWMCGCYTVSALNADSSALSGFSGSITWLIVAAFTFCLPAIDPPVPQGPCTLTQRLGLDALTLLRNRDHRVVFITAALFCIPVAGFYPFTPPHLRDLGLARTSAWMGLGQITEIMAMFAIAQLLTHWRLKWIFAVGLALGVLRFALCALDTRWGVVAGIALHGCSYTLVFITAQIYLEERVDASWRTRAQALLTLMTSGVGNLIGYLGTGLWIAASTDTEHVHWPRFWLGLSMAMGVVMLYFLATYHGRGPGTRRDAPEPDPSVYQAPTPE